MNAVERCNAVRKRIPFAYWLCYDAVLLPFLIWAMVAFSYAFVIPAVMLAVAVFFDVTEAIAKWGER